MEEGRKKRGKAITRRDFIKGFSGGAIGAAVAPRLLTQEAESLQPEAGKVPLYSKKPITLTVNEKKYSVVVEPRETLLHLLRERLNLTGTKMTCDRGECGGCTVILDGVAVYSCMYPAIRADGKKITTVEGLAVDGKLRPVQKAFIEKDGYQCGFCTPGFIMSSVVFLEKNNNPKRKEIKATLSGNICRCGNYFKIYEAVEAAAKNMRRP